jgi:hypothetical protein
LKYIKLFAIARLQNILYFLDFEYFTRLIRRENGEIGGSIHPQRFLGSEFQANDIDIFVYGSQEYGFSPLHKYLFSKSIRREVKTEPFRHASSTSVYQDIRISDHFRVRHAYRVISVWDYYFVCRVLVLITIFVHVHMKTYVKV